MDNKRPVGTFMRAGLWCVLLADGTDRHIIDKTELNALPMIGAAASTVAPLLASGAKAREQRDEYLRAVGSLSNALKRKRRADKARQEAR